MRIQRLKRPANSWALNDPDLNKEYSLLSEEQKNKNRDIIVQGIGLYDPLKFVAAASPLNALDEAKEVLAKNAHNAWRDGVIAKAGETVLDQENKLVTPRGRASENTDWDQQKKIEISVGQYVDVTLDLTAKQQEALKGGRLLKMPDSAYIIQMLDGSIQLDTLNTLYETLSPAWKGKNSAAVGAAAGYYQDALARGFEIRELQAGLSDAIQHGKSGQKLSPEYVADDALRGFIVEVGTKEHERWMKANDWMKADNPQLFVDFSDLPAEEQYKDLEGLKQLVDYMEGDLAKGSSPMLTESGTTNKLGGIDFRTMNILVQPMGNFSGLDFTLPKLSNLMKFDIEEEFREIQNMVAAGIIPSGMRIKELIAACSQKNEIDIRTDELLVCLADIFKLEEESLTESSPELKESLVILD